LRKIITVLIIIGLLPIALFAQTREKTIKITTLIENRKMKDIEGIVAEHGLSLYIERHGQTILFDTGASDNFLRNAETLGVDIKNVDIVVISHAHMDHVGGLPYFLEVNSKAMVYMSRNAKKHLEFTNFFLKMGEEYSNRIQFIDEFTKIAEGTYLLTGIKRNELILDYVDHEISLVLKDGYGLVLFTGCSHSGIFNIVDAVTKKFPNIFIKAVFGGFHREGLPVRTEYEMKEYIENIGKQMYKYPVIKIYTGHCTGMKPYQILKGVLGVKLEYFATGSRIYLF
jgi:7,8-dihydropterin-6-yl-methyl-4-(beta-D-ribofuranosyl)aminobenzene 5'-phosphate synthase